MGYRLAGRRHSTGPPHRHRQVSRHLQSHLIYCQRYMKTMRSTDHGLYRSGCLKRPGPWRLKLPSRPREVFHQRGDSPTECLTLDLAWVRSRPSMPCRHHRRGECWLTARPTTLSRLCVPMKPPPSFPIRGTLTTHPRASRMGHHVLRQPPLLRQRLVMWDRYWGCNHIPQPPSSGALRHPSAAFVSATGIEEQAGSEQRQQ